MAMKKFLTFLTIAFVLTLTFSMWGFSNGQNVAEADEATSYIHIEPSDESLKNNEFAGVSSVEVKDKTTGELLFYLIESYYYPVLAQPLLNTYYELNIDGVEGLVEIASLSESPKGYDGVSFDNALPSSILLKEGVTISVKGHTVDTRDGWTVKLVGVNGDSFFVVASKDDVVVSGLALKENFTTSNIQYHANALAKREGMLNQTPDGEVESDNGTDKSVVLRIVLIIGIAVPAIIIAIMIFKPGRASSKTNYDRHAMRTRREEEIDYDRDRSYDRERDYSRRQPYSDRDYRDDRRDDRDYRDGRDDRRYDDRYDDRRYDDRRDDRRYDDRYDDRNGRR